MSHTLIVLISGEGTNLQALIDQQSVTGRIIKVISSTKYARGLKRAEEANIPTCCHSIAKYKRESSNDEDARNRYCADLAAIILESRPSLVCCAGWMLVLKPSFLSPLDEAGIPVINLHPALPGQFPGRNAIQDAHVAYHNGKITKTGIMIHYVIEEVDAGEPLLVKEIEMSPEDSMEELKQRIHKVEWPSLVEAVKLALQRLDKKRVKS